MTWFTENLGTILVCAVLAAAAVISIRHIYRARKNGGCTGCPNCGSCSSHCGSRSEK